MKKSGVSIRTLRYYDSIDLLKPSDYTEGGHRQLVGLDNHFSLYTSIFVTSLLFAIVHIPSIKLVATKPKKEMYVYTIVGNIWVGLCASFAFIESGLFAAIVVHML